MNAHSEATPKNNKNTTIRLLVRDRKHRAGDLSPTGRGHRKTTDHLTDDAYRERKCADTTEMLKSLYFSQAFNIC